MLNEQDFIINKIEEVIKQQGIPLYLSKWKPKKSKTHFTSEKKFIDYLKTFVKSYHSHTSIDISKKYKKITIEKQSKKLPTFYYDDKTKIGRIKYYDYYLDFDDKYHKCEKFKLLVNTVRNKLKEWYKDGMKGLIIDLSQHKGGWFEPFVHSLDSILNNTTLFGYGKNKLQKSKKSWINYKNHNTEYGQKFLSNKINLNIPLAVIIGKNTASSGEFCASIFYRKNKKIKIFGQNTYGKLSFNDSIEITPTIKLNLTLNLVTTVDGIFRIKEYLKPDIKTNTPITDAKKWILKSF
jgi:C-terminal processing protease CtpA/Prc